MKKFIQKNKGNLIVSAIIFVALSLLFYVLEGYWDWKSSVAIIIGITLGWLVGKK